MFTYVEVPVEDLERAVRFYEAVLRVKTTRGQIHGHPMAFFPDAPDGRVTGALVAGDTYEPSRVGPRVYFWTEDIDATLERVVAHGGEVTFAAAETEEGWVAEFLDSEGNRVALHEPKPKTLVQRIIDLAS